MKSISLWLFSVVFTLAIAYYQRTTGPTYPVRDTVTIQDKVLRYKLPRSSDSDKAAEIKINFPDPTIVGYIEYKKFKTAEEWKRTDLFIRGDFLVGELPPQPPAGKLVYTVKIISGDKTITLNEEPVVIRFKGPVPDYILFPHIIIMFLAMLFSTRTGLEAIFKGEKTYSYTRLTLIFLLLGGMILGPVVQKFAFGEFWTGWPFGQDLTDNKTLVAFVAWIVAVVRLKKDRNNRGWAVAASVILLLVYLIPHSLFGSELDYSTGEIGTGN